MIVIHAIWDNYTNNKLQLWAESSSLTGSAARRAKKQAEEPQSRQHPFSLQREPLRDAISELAGNLLAKSAGSGNVRLLLPSTGSGPLSSPELILEKEPAEMEATGFSSWDVGTLALDPDDALDFLLSMPNYAPLGMAFGSSLRFWNAAAAFAFELIARQSYVPTLEERHQNGVSIYRAAWQVVIAEEDSERVSLLAKAMPPVCWAFLPSSEMKPSVLQNVLLTFLNQTLDAFVRKSLSSTSLLPTRPTHSERSSKVSLAEQWLQALVSDQSTLVATPEELQRFSATLHNWIDQIRPVETGAAFRTCFRLDAPGEPGEPGEDNEKSSDWRISFYLQANDDRSLLVPAHKVWKERSSTLTFLKRKFENPQERLLADLGKATRLFPTLEESLRAARPEELKLNTEQAYTFLRESAPLLEQSGFGVLVPPWWQKPTARLGVKLKVKSQADANTNSGLLGLKSIVNYDWTIAVGDTDLSIEEFESLVNLKVPLIQIRGQWVELRPEEIEAAIAFFKKKHSNGHMSLGEALRIGLGQEASELGLPINSIEGDGWIKELLDKLMGNNKIATIKTPSTFQGKLRPYQLKGVSWLAFLEQFGFGACLADDMGLGKTAELIALLLHTHSTRQRALQVNPALVICPMSIVGNWHKELQRFAPSLSVMIHHGHERLSGEAFAQEAKRHDVVITTYSLALRDKEHLAAIEWEYVVVDEAQNIKNDAAKQTQAIKKLNARHKIALTGTPVENRLSELWSIMEFLNPGYLGFGVDFRKNFAIPIERYRDANRAEALKRLIQPFVLRRYLQETLGRETLFLYGGTPKKQRDVIVQRFQEERRAAPLFILSLKAGGVGLNLTAANHVFHFDRWWNPAVENQATDRAFRIGQRKNVQVHKFVCIGTLEERIDQMIEQKKELADNIVGSGENWLTEMSTAQLKELFTLSRAAVGE